MTVTGLIVWLVIGGAAGWLASLVMGGGFGLVGNIVLGIVGAFVAGWLFPFFDFGMGGGIVPAIIHAAIGAIIVLAIVRMLKRA